jgi:hypothetical protein
LINHNLFTSKFVNLVNNFGNLDIKPFSISNSKNQLSSLNVNQREAFSFLTVIKNTPLNIRLAIINKNRLDKIDWESIR